MKMNRIISAILVLAMMFSMIAWEGGPLTLLVNAAWDGTASSSFYSGSGTQSSPYLIKTVGQMGYFRQLLSEGVTFEGKYLRLDADLDMTGGNWTSVSTQFCGDFNGNGHKLTVDTQFVGTIGEGGRVYRLKMVSATQSDSLICSTNRGAIEGCMATGTVWGDESYAGGLATYNYGTMMNVAFVGTIGGPDMDVGGLVYSNSGTIHNAYASAVLDAWSTDRYYLSSEDAAINKNSGVATNVYYNSTKGSSPNGIGVPEADMKLQSFVDTLNQANDSVVSKWAKDTSGSNSGFPVIVADNKSDIACSLTNIAEDTFICNSGTKLTITKSSTKSCTIYYTLDGTDPTTSSTRKTYNSSGFTVTADTTIKMVAKEGSVYGRVRTQKAYVMAGRGTEAAPYQITTKAQLRGLHIAPSAYFELKNDLTFSASDFAVGGTFPGGWEPVGSFSGVLEGNGHKISNMQGSYGGFVESNSGTISGIRFMNHQLRVDGNDYGAIAHDNTGGTITKCYVELNTQVNAYYYVGGIVGDNYSGTISYCQVVGTMKVYADATYTTARIGGIAGNGGAVINCYSRLNMPITGNGYYLKFAGIVYNGRATNCRAENTASFGMSLSYTATPDMVSSSTVEGCYASLTYSCPGYINAFYEPVQQGTSIRTDSGKLLESNFPNLDFTEGWMITADGPMPQGVMNADGKCYTKTGYRQPACANGYTKYVDQFGNAGTISLAANGIHFGGAATCTNPATCEVCGVSFGTTNPNNHVAARPVDVQNDTSYPFTYANGKYTSTNKASNSASMLTVVAPFDMTVGITIDCSSEPNYDKGIVAKNGTQLFEVSGVATKTESVSLVAGDVLTIKYKKDVSVDKNNDNIVVTLDLPTVAAEPTCTSGVNCALCGVEVASALGHSFLSGTNDTSYPFTYAGGVYTSTNKANYSVSAYTYTASAAVKLSVDYSVSSEANCDKLLIQKNGSTIYTYSGSQSGKLEITLAQGDTLVFKYSKDSSRASGSDSASFAITSQERVDACTSSANCATCGYLPATGHSFIDCICTVCGAEDLLGSGSCGTNVTWRLRRNGKMIISGTGPMTDYTFGSYSARPWNTYVYNQITSVVIEDGVTSVGGYAFYDCRKLTDAVIGDTVTVIGEGAFRHTGLRQVTLGKNVVELGEDSFYDNHYLGNVTLPEGLQIIGKSAFSWCLEMTEMHIPDSVTSIGVYAFCNNDKLETVTIGSGVTSIADDAFCNCDKLTGIWVSEENTAFSNDTYGALYNKDKTALIQVPNTYVGDYVIPEGVVSIREYAFYCCNTVMYITIPASVRAESSVINLLQCGMLKGVRVSEDNPDFSSDDSGVLYNKEKTVLLQAGKGLSYRYDIPETVESIAYGAFYKVVSLDVVYIPSGVTSIGRDAFYLSGVSHVLFGGTSEQWAGFTDLNLEDATVHFVENNEAKAPTCTDIGWDAYWSCKDCDYSTYVETPALGHSFTDYVSDHNATCVTNCTKTAKCDRCDETDTTDIPDTALGHVFLDSACIRCGDTADLYLYEVNDGAATITGCLPDAAVGVLTIPETLGGYPVTAIADNAFANCQQMTGITIPDSVTAIGDSAFAGCTGLTTVTMSMGIASVGSAAFDGCVALAEVFYAADQTQAESISIADGNDLLLAALWNYQHFHDFTLFPEITVEATCTENGYIEYMCIFGETYRKTILALGHDHSSIRTVEPTCTEAGYTQIYCSRCGDVKSTEPIAALDHDYSGEVTVVAPDCLNGGYTLTKCIRCDSTQTSDPVDALGHQCTMPVQTVEADCLNGGYTVYKCVRCDETEARDQVDALGHDCTEVAQIVEADCLGGGYTVYKCIRCDETETRDQVDALGHDYSGDVTVVASTCQEKGYTLTKCIRCDSTQTSNITNVVAHKMVILPAVAPTCTESGLTMGSMCQYCGRVGLAQTEVAATGHTMVSHEAKAPTCTETGWEAYEACANCDYSTCVELPVSHSFEGTICTICGHDQVRLAITTVTLRPEAAGLYFTGSFEIEEGVEVVRKGIALSVYGEMPTVDDANSRSLWTEGSTSVLVKNILSDRSTANNEARAAMVIYARAYVELADGTYKYSEVVGINLRQVIEAADAQWDTLDDTQKTALEAMYAKFAKYLDLWDVPNMKKK